MQPMTLSAETQNEQPAPSTGGPGGLRWVWKSKRGREKCFSMISPGFATVYQNYICRTAVELKEADVHILFVRVSRMFLSNRVLRKSVFGEIAGTCKRAGMRELPVTGSLTHGSICT